MADAANQCLFHDQRSLPLTGVSFEAFTEGCAAAREHHGITPIQMAEAAGFSCAMVVRHALGLSSLDGILLAVVTPTLAGAITLCCLRHLIFSGVSATVFELGTLTDDPLTAQLAAPLRSNAAQFLALADISNEDFTARLGAAHAIMLGTFGASTQFSPPLAEILNEHRVPVHSIFLPPGISPQNGSCEPWAVYSSSTLALGLPLECMYRAYDYMGRLYLCDISLPPEVTAAMSPRAREVFSEQPVIQIFPAVEQEAAAL
jgi:NAD(P)H-hydrate repair Nnr-like enzyme with NAD(P)H-hydrate epimerase domain